jgi:hypothetical protein
MPSTSSSEDSHYFRLPRLPWLVVLPPGLALLAAAAWKPDAIPFEYLGPLKGFVQSAINDHPTKVQRTATITLLIHVVEAIYATYFARQKKLSNGVALAWGAQTFIYGIFSIIPLRRHFKKKRS